MLYHIVVVLESSVVASAARISSEYPNDVAASSDLCDILGM